MARRVMPVVYVKARPDRQHSWRAAARPLFGIAINGIAPYSAVVEHNLNPAVSLVDPEIEATLGVEGVFASAQSGFRVRTGQLEMASAVLNAMRTAAPLIVEAGTGTGKTYAYLVPAILAGGKVIVSTGTRTLQDQLFHRDLPLVKRLLGVPVELALLKGRANYVCHHHLQRTVADGRLASRDEVRQLREIEHFAALTRTGDRAELAGVPESAPIWTQVTSTRESCLGSDCAFHAECFVLEARRRAQNADIVVVNHHLFFADVMLKDEGMGELLPACNSVIFDEAHQLPEVASLFFGDSVSTAQILDVTRDARAEGRVVAAFPREIEDTLDRADKAARELRLVFREREGRQAHASLLGNPTFMPALETLASALDAACVALDSQAARSEGLLACARRAIELQRRINGWLGRSAGTAAPSHPATPLIAGSDQDSAWAEGTAPDATPGATGASGTPELAGEAPDLASSEARVRWLELFHQSLHLNSTPLSVASLFQR